jgi:anti-anti-sigma factor
LGAPFACNWTSTRGAAWATLTGELDIAQAPMLEHALRTAEVGAHLVVLDLRELSFIDCTGLRVIYESSERLRQAGHRLIVVRGPRPVDMVFTHTGIAERIEVVDLQPAEPAIRVLEIVGAQPGT